MKMANTPNIRYGYEPIDLWFDGRVGTLFLFITQIGQPDEMHIAQPNRTRTGKYRVE